jgi:very-short-patch-repair endonuclease
MPTKPTLDILRERARQLRREQTDAEKKLWALLPARQLNGYKFRRQFVIGSVITDFCCFEHRLVIELDGGQHADQTAADQRRSAFLRSRGYRVLRFWDNEVLKNSDAVLEKIAHALDAMKLKSEPSPEPSPSGRGPEDKIGTELSDNPNRKSKMSME